MFRPIAYYSRRALHALLSGPRAVAWLLLAPFRWIGGLFSQIAAWWSRRESRYLVRGLPALVAFVGAAFLLIACRMQSNTVLAEKYLSAARLSEAARPAAAAMLLERVVQLRGGPDPDEDKETLFELATMAQRAGDQARTAVLMRQLAPDPREGRGYWPAHMEMGKSYLRIQHLATENFVKAKSHFEQVLVQKPDNADAYAYLGQLYFGRGLWDRAIENFQLALKHGRNDDGEVHRHLQVVLVLVAKAYAKKAEVTKSEADRLQAANFAENARKLFAARVAEQPNDDAESRIILADACMFLEDFEGAEYVLNEGLLLNTGDEDQQALRAAMARFNVSWADALLLQADAPEDSRKRRFELLSSALLLDPHYALIFDRMMKILVEQGETAEAAREFLTQNVSSGRSIGLSHLLLGSDAFGAGDAKTAEFHLERAYQALPNALIVTNNLAWFLAFREPADLDRALSLINNVLKRSPNDPRFLDTRGQINTKLERWDEAIADLERALQQGIPGAETHEALAVCYAAKGLPELEHLHRQSAAAERAN